METTERSHLLRDLALIYLTMAHGTDEDLDNAEVDTIAEVLHDWEDDASHDSVLGAIKAGLTAYSRPDALDEVNQAIDHVRKNLSDQERQKIMDDLVEIAMSDGRFLHAESKFIGDLARAWEVTLRDERLNEPWSLLRPEGPHAHWTPIHDLTLVYIVLAYETDYDLSDEEVEAIAENINDWVPDASRDKVMSVVNNVISTYVQQDDRQLFNECVFALRETVPKHQRAPLIRDLREVAYADGTIIEEEERLIRELAEAWDVSWEVEPDYDENDKHYGDS